MSHRRALWNCIFLILHFESYSPKTTSNYDNIGRIYHGFQLEYLTVKCEVMMLIIHEKLIVNWISVCFFSIFYQICLEDYGHMVKIRNPSYCIDLKIQLAPNDPTENLGLRIQISAYFIQFCINVMIKVYNKSGKLVFETELGFKIWKYRVRSESMVFNYPVLLCS